MYYVYYVRVCIHVHVLALNFSWAHNCSNIVMCTSSAYSIHYTHALAGMVVSPVFGKLSRAIACKAYVLNFM